MAIKYTSNFHCKTLQNLPQEGFLVKKNHLATLGVKLRQKKTPVNRRAHGQMLFKGVRQPQRRQRLRRRQPDAADAAESAQRPGLPEGILSNQKILIRVKLGGTCNGRHTYFMYILLPFGLFCGQLVYFSSFWYVVLRKIWQPCPTPRKSWVRQTVAPKTILIMTGNLGRYIHVHIAFSAKEVIHP
jgi:hypothetical protein